MNENVANFIGREGFNWWVGQVENDGNKFWNSELEDGLGDFDYSDYDWTNKVKVRIVGYHNPNRKELPTQDLPWAIVGLLDSLWMEHQHKFLLLWEVLLTKILVVVME